jgi:molybdate transport system ATP-binding protein
MRLDVDLERSYAGGEPIRARFSLELGGSPVAVLFGPSGAGKTTILRCIAGLDRPDAGRIAFGAEPWFDRERGVHLDGQRRGTGVLFPDHPLFPHLTVAENIAYGLFRTGRAERGARTLALARLVGVEPLLLRRPAQLSSGQQQRVALARALAPRPRLLLADEPLAALDAPSREELRRDLRRLLAATGTPAILVTHDRDEALAIGDTMVVLAEGRVRQVGPVEEVFSRPADAVVARAVGTENVLAGRCSGRAEGLATVEVSGRFLTAVDPGEVHGPVLVCIRAEEVVLEGAGGAPTSARNRLDATVVGVEPRGALARVSLDCGFPLVALVTRRSVEELRLVPGLRLVALVKAPAVRVVPHP